MLLKLDDIINWEQLSKDLTREKKEAGISDDYAFFYETTKFLYYPEVVDYYKNKYENFVEGED